jgi:translation initiation factor 2B subunit (eIF-2B alpha/beta/delta family)
MLRLIEEIRNDRTRGAIELAREATRVLKAATESSQADDVSLFLDELRKIGQELISVRPPMAPIHNIVNHLLGEISGRAAVGSLDILRKFTLSTIDRVINESLRAQAAIISYARDLIAEGDRIMTHSYSSTVIAFLGETASRLRGIEVIVTRSGPGRTGEEIARRLGESGIKVIFIDDTAAGLYVPVMSKLLLGADTVSADGVLNGVGSYQVAVLAARHGVPVYVLADTLKFDMIPGHREFDVEDRDGTELAAQATLAGTVTVRNPHFDVTPLELITGIVTEQGVMTPDAVIAFLNNKRMI